MQENMPRPVLPSFSTIIDSTSATSSPLPKTGFGFRMDVQGNIKLPPLGGDPQTPIMRNNLLSITPTTSMVRMGIGSLSGINKSTIFSDKDRVSLTCLSGENQNIDSFIDGSCNRIDIVSGDLGHTPSKKSRVFDKNSLTMPDCQPSMSTPRSQSPTENRLDFKGTPVSAKRKTPKTKAFAFITHSQETFPSNEPTIDNAQLARRKRRRTSKNESEILKNEFKINPVPSKTRRAELAAQCNMSEKAVQVWFQNRRQNVRKKIRNNPENLDSLNTSSTVRSNRALQELNPNIKRNVISKSNDETNEKNEEISRSPLDENIPISKQVEENVFQSKPSINASMKFQKKLKLDLPKYTITHCTENATTINEKGKVLTFRLKQDNELSRVYTSPNKRVNKLINGATVQDETTSTTETASKNSNDSGIKSDHLNFNCNRGILKELDVNVI